MSKVSSINPSNYQVIGEVTASTPEEIAAKVEKAKAASEAWRGLGLKGRIELMREVAKKFDQEHERVIALTAQEMGMPLQELEEDMDSGLEYLNSYCDTAEDILKPEVTYETDEERHEVIHEPYGVAAVIVPWNFPFVNWVWQCGQNLVAGNTVVFKHSEETPLCGQLIEEIVNSVLPEGVFNEVYGDGSIGEVLISQDVNLICFTGSTSTGAKINESAAKRFIPTVMELGGSAPGLIFEDADTEAIKETLYMNRFMNCGQLCDALKRLIVHESKFDEVVKALTGEVESKKIGDASDEATELGPLVAKRQLELLEAQVADAIQKGAKVVTGGKRPEGLNGAYYQPTILINVTTDMHVWQEEVFGPVLPIVSFRDEAEAIRLANDTKYGLGAYIFTADAGKFRRVAEKLESGMVSQNNVSYLNVCNPFGGYKMSGGGREHAKYGFLEVTQTKIISSEK